MLILKQNVSAGTELKKKKPREKQRLRKKKQGENLSQIENDIANIKDDTKSAKMMLQDANEQLSKEIKKAKLCKESIMKSKTIIQLIVGGARHFTERIREKERRTSLKEKETIKICHVNGKGSFHNGNM